MGFSKEEFERMTQRVEGNSGKKAVVLQEAPRKGRGKTEPRDNSMNKLETRYAQHLEAEKRAGRITDYKFEGVKLRLADSTGLTMDFMVIDADGFVQFHDTKAFFKSTGKPHIEEDANVKLKVAAEQYPYFEFRIVWEEGAVPGNWQHKKF